MRGLMAAAAAVLFAATAVGQGVSVYSHGGCVLGQAGSGVADPCRDGSAIFYNPAALAAQPGRAGLGTLLLFTHIDFTFEGGGRFESIQPAAWAPSAWVTARLGRLAAGVGVWAPYGLSTRWPRSFEGRFVGYDNTLSGIYIQPTLAYEPVAGKLGVGVGLAVVRGSVRIHRRVDLASANIPNTEVPFSALGVPAGTDFVDADLDVHDWSITFNAGVSYRPDERWAVGLRYLHDAPLDLHGSADFEQIATGFLLPPGNPLGLPAGTPIDPILAALFQPGATLAKQRLSTAMTLPNQIIAGVRFTPLGTLRLLLDYQWTNWSDFDEARLHFVRAPEETLFLDFRNTSTLRLGANYDVRPDLTARAGIAFNEAASSAHAVTPLLAEAQRVSLAAGLGYHVNDRLTADAAFEVILQDDRRGSVRPHTSRPPPDLRVGLYESRGYVVGLTLSYRLPDLRTLLQPPTSN